MYICTIYTRHIITICNCNCYHSRNTFRINYAAKIRRKKIPHKENTFFNTNLTFIYILHKKHKSVQCSINYIILYVHIYGTRFLHSGRLFSVRCKVIRGGCPLCSPEAAKRYIKK